MRVLYLAHRVPFPPNKGDKIRSFHQIRHLSRAHEIHLLAFFDDPTDRKHAAALSDFCQEVELVPLRPWPQRFKAGQALLLRRPWTLGYFDSMQMRQAVSRKLRSQTFDLAFVYSSSMAPYVSGECIPKVLDFVDSDASKWKQFSERKAWPASLLYRSEGWRLAMFESEMIRRFDASIFVSSRETIHLENPEELKKIHFVQNGVDFEFFAPQDGASSSPTAVFTGAMDYYPNVDAVDHFANHVFPIIRQQKASARFVIVGSRPSRKVQRLTRQAGVEVTGAVPDTRPYLASAAVAVAPLRIAQGIQNKILEALAMGVPVVATSKAAAGIEDLQSLPLIVADKPEDQAHAVLKIMSHGQRIDSDIAKVRAYLEKGYSWEYHALALESVFERIAGLPKRSSSTSLVR